MQNKLNTFISIFLITACGGSSTSALHQAVATDLRFLIVVLKVNNDLEWLGDLAANIAEDIIFMEEGIWRQTEDKRLTDRSAL
jgi:phosphate uptake regulator